MITIPVTQEDIMIDFTISHQLMLAVVFMLFSLFSLERIKPKHAFTNQQVAMLMALEKMKVKI